MSLHHMFGDNFFQQFRGDLMDLHQLQDCLFGKPVITYMLSYVQDLLGMYGSKSKFIQMNGMLGHNDLMGRIEMVDQPMSNFLKNESLSRTIVFLLGDHGWHANNGLNKLWNGEYEHRNPFLEVLVPSSYLKRFPNSLKTLAINQKRIITPWDLYKTFTALASRLGRKKAPSANELAYDLFTQEIPESRTCETANIGKKWCNCWSALSEEEFIENIKQNNIDKEREKELAAALHNKMEEEQKLLLTSQQKNLEEKKAQYLREASKIGKFNITSFRKHHVVKSTT